MGGRRPQQGTRGELTFQLASPVALSIHIFTPPNSPSASTFTASKDLSETKKAAKPPGKWKLITPLALAKPLPESKESHSALDLVKQALSPAGVTRFSFLSGPPSFMHVKRGVWVGI